MNNRIKNSKQVKNISVLCDKEWIPIDFIHKTVKFRKYIVLFESGKEIECADNHCFINKEYQQIHAKDLKIGEKILSIEGYDIVFDVFDTKINEEMYDITLQYHHLYYTNGILSHNSNIMGNIISRQILNNIKVGLATLEMSTDMYAQRFDANLTNFDINRIYINKKLRGKFLKNIKEIKNNVDKGALYIKEYPTGKANVNDFRIWLRELGMRDKLPNIFFCDYISLMKPEGKSKGDLFVDGKTISEELRALGFEFNIPIVSVAQINRVSTFLEFESLDMNSIAESYGIPGTCDSMMVQGTDEDSMIYQNELRWKCVKNRLGGRVGELGKWYYDQKSLRIYDEQELDLWIEEAKKSGDERKPYERSE
jgi:hypothetical protein